MNEGVGSVLVCGGREFSNRELMWFTLDSLMPISLVIHGGARGADSLAGEWAKERGIPVRVFAADWKRLKLAAGAIRNRQMLEEGKPQLVVAFPGGRGTHDMVTKALAAGLPVIQLRKETAA